jgi:hypothetical protein
MDDHRHQLARLRTAAATGVLPSDLGLWAIDLLEELEPATERIQRRNTLLRAAADRLSGSRWAKAGRLEVELRALDASRRFRTRAVEDVDGIRDMVARALQADPDSPHSRRQLFRLLGRD